jgi:hypothetical protein
MNLQNKLDEMRKQFKSSAPPEVLTVMHHAGDDLLHTGILENILKVGYRCPGLSPLCGNA